MPGSTIGVKLDDETRDRLKSLGSLKDRSPHWIMKTAIREYLDREEVFEREKREDRERWERYILTDSFIDNDSMMRWLDGLAEQARGKGSE